MVDIKNLEAPISTVTIERNQFDAPTDNIYEAISVVAKRAIQIIQKLKKN